MVFPPTDFPVSLILTPLGRRRHGTHPMGRDGRCVGSLPLELWAPCKAVSSNPSNATTHHVTSLCLSFHTHKMGVVRWSEPLQF